VFVLPFQRDPTNNPVGLTTHFFWEKKTNSWWEDQIGTSSAQGTQPTAVAVLDSDEPNDRTLVLGGADGIVRKWDKDAKNDDTTAAGTKIAIDSRVLIGPLHVAQAGAEIRTSRFTPVLASDQDGCNFQYFLSDEPDNEGDPVAQGPLLAGRNVTQSARARGSYLWLKMRNAGLNSRWAYESATAHTAKAGPKRARARR